MAAAALLSSFLNRVGVDAQGDVRLGVPQALADRDDIHTRVDQLGGAGVPQGVERHVRHPDPPREEAPRLVTRRKGTVACRPGP